MSVYNTPPSLKWLIVTRAKQLGRLIEFESELKKLQLQHEQKLAEAASALESARAELEEIKQKGWEKLQALRAGLEAIDTTLAFHEIQIDPNWIKPVKSQKIGRLEPHGAITQGIYKALKSAHGAPLTTTEVAKSVIVSEKIFMPDAAFDDFRHRVRMRLKRLCWDGKLQRLHDPKTHLEGRWSLLEQDASLR